ncbi:acyl-CoA thioesterase [Ruania halotolerans]|uniref:acyl-CoA thioesterase n=1 Tax=Ruania halotolerans TaxID=2897773 RepID=UPI001E49B00C|nr:thioesterase family protein [Ruania halotolerans]UFU05319.1 acyl-CoA thioesterase [Ruania halotolerans]
MPRVRVPVPMRWSDVDAYGHVNNAAMLTLLEEARIATFWADGSEGPAVGTKVLTAGPTATSFTLVARQEIEYLAPLDYSQEPVPVDLWVGRIGGASLEVCYEVYSPAGALCAKAATSIVMVDAATGRPRRLADSERGALEALLEAPIEFRRR